MATNVVAINVAAATVAAAPSVAAVVERNCQLGSKAKAL